MYLFVDRAGKQDLLKYSYGEYLDNIAALKGITRNAAAAAVVKVRFTLSAIQKTAIGIPADTRVTNMSIYFATDAYVEIPAGSMYADVSCTAQTAGESGNGIIDGELNTLVDPIPYVKSAVNIETSYGGADKESDENLAGRVFLAPASYSTAGPTDAYEYWARSYSTSIGSVKVTSPEACQVEVRFLLSDGSLPTGTLIADVLEYLSDKTRRPLTDKVTCLAPETVKFDIGFTYYINASDEKKASTIQNAVAAAVEDYKSWQCLTIGRDINPSELIKRVVAAGAKRVIVTKPEFTAIPETSVSRVNTETVTYGGLEDD